MLLAACGENNICMRPSELFKAEEIVKHREIKEVIKERFFTSIFVFFP